MALEKTAVQRSPGWSELSRLPLQGRVLGRAVLAVTRLAVRGRLNARQAAGAFEEARALHNYGTPEPFTIFRRGP